MEQKSTEEQVFEALIKRAYEIYLTDKEKYNILLDKIKSELKPNTYTCKENVS